MATTISKTTVEKLVSDTLFPAWRAERNDMLRLDRWHRNALEAGRDLPQLKKGTSEYATLQKISKTPWARLVVASTVDVLRISGFLDRDGSPHPVWDVWQANGMDGRQTALWQGATALGRSYVTVLPGKDPLTGEPRPSIRMWPATRAIAWYEDPANDDWPLYGMTGDRATAQDGSKFWRMHVYSDGERFTVDVTDDGKATYVEVMTHQAEVVPMVQFAPNMDLEGRTPGEVEPYIDVISRINQTTLDRYVVERFGAWVVRWATGLETPKTEDGEVDSEAQAATKLKLSIEDILVSSGEHTKFGTLEGTSMDPYISAEEWAVRTLAVVSQSTPSQFVGQVENLSADAIAALNAPHRGKIDRHKLALGEQAEQMFRLIGAYQGERIDHSGQVMWRDSESRSLSQLADALTKLVQGLKIPADQFWPQVAEALGRPQQDVEAWRRAAENSDELGRLLASLANDVEDDANGDF